MSAGSSNTVEPDGAVFNCGGHVASMDWAPSHPGAHTLHLAVSLLLASLCIPTATVFWLKHCRPDKALLRRSLSGTSVNEARLQSRVLFCWQSKFDGESHTEHKRAFPGSRPSKGQAAECDRPRAGGSSAAADLAHRHWPAKPGPRSLPARRPGLGLQVAAITGSTRKRVSSL